MSDTVAMNDAVAVYQASAVCAADAVSPWVRRCAPLIPGGEVLDLAASSGGENLQAAFSTGYVAGESAALSLTNRKP